MTPHDRLAGITETERVVAEVRRVTGRRLRAKDIGRWSESEALLRKTTNADLLELVYCPEMGVWVEVWKATGETVRQGSFNV